MQLVSLLTDAGVANFLFLLLRFAGVFTFFPFFENQLIPVSVRGALTLYMTLLFYPIVPHQIPPMEPIAFILGGLSEIMLGFLSSVFLQIVFGMINFGGETISFSMGLTMASAFDPVSGTQKAIVGQIIVMLALLILLAANFHHLILEFVAFSLTQIPLGGFVFSPHIVPYIVKAFTNLFLIGFTMAFPIAALILLSDIIFGMIMKTHPQFNLLVIGFPVKISLAFMVLIVIIPAIMVHFKREIALAFDALQMFFVR
ncbi:flagellar biosynthetic protein FliR [Helicobacter monodelphidis]|uniref:flagellar biosynthetic protein FliR n=1 Tax=Helicobacter sp. 15-1451 TaxID=2004995 RepID=UPI000DCC1602|nr:flagellar biosynthetic protein FliR [Helicobacter sp. 15-1451]RAX58619.1 flagellar biosynthetic protein FliR [Helicobacter sp. 15-1451]